MYNFWPGKVKSLGENTLFSLYVGTYKQYIYDICTRYKLSLVSRRTYQLNGGGGRSYPQVIRSDPPRASLSHRSSSPIYRRPGHRSIGPPTISADAGASISRRGFTPPLPRRTLRKSSYIYIYNSSTYVVQTIATLFIPAHIPTPAFNMYRTTPLYTHISVML